MQKPNLIQPKPTPEQVKALREKAGLSQGALAELIGLSNRQLIGDYENGKKLPNAQTWTLMLLATSQHQKFKLQDKNAMNLTTLELHSIKQLLEKEIKLLEKSKENAAPVVQVTTNAFIKSYTAIIDKIEAEKHAIAAENKKNGEILTLNQLLDKFKEVLYNKTSIATTLKTSGALVNSNWEWEFGSALTDFETAINQNTDFIVTQYDGKFLDARFLVVPKDLYQSAL